MRSSAGASAAPQPNELTIKDLLSYRIHQVSSQMSRSAALQYRHNFDVSLGEWRALALLGAGAALSLNELARAADLDKAQMSRIVAGLEKRELVAREEGPTRGQTVRLTLTRRGQSTYRKLIEAAVKRNDAFLACLTAQESKVLDAALLKLSTLARALIAAEPSGSARSTRQSVDNDNSSY
jgi:DNA-binding MarR family transcriptional regulator